MNRWKLWIHNMIRIEFPYLMNVVKGGTVMVTNSVVIRLKACNPNLDFLWLVSIFKRKFLLIKCYQIFRILKYLYDGLLKLYGDRKIGTWTWVRVILNLHTVFIVNIKCKQTNVSLFGHCLLSSKFTIDFKNMFYV